MHRGLAVAVLVASTLLAAGCGDDDETAESSAVANPASAYCEAQGGRVEIEDGPGGQVGFCVLPDGSRVEEWDLYRRRDDASEACSGGGDAEVAPEPSLPAVVDEVRRDIVAAAAVCDFEALAELVDRHGAGIRYTFGEPGDPIAAWREQEEGGAEPMRALRLLLALPAARTQGPEGVTYVWPAAFAVEHPDEAALREVADTGLYTLEQLQAWVDSGTNYLGFRVFVTDAGDWTLFVEGD